MGLSQEVRQEVPRRIEQYEGRVNHFYLDRLGFVTIGMVVMAAVLLGCSGAPRTGVGALTPAFNDSAVMGWASGGPGEGEALSLHLEVELDSGEITPLEDCEEVMALDPEAVPSVNFRYLLRARNDCRAVAYFEGAQEARVSHLGGRHLTEELLGRFPASSKPRLSRHDHPPESHSVRLVDEEAIDGMDVRTDGSHVLSGPRSLYIVQALAWGGFTADGVEDVMVRVDWLPLDAVGGVSTVVVLTGDSQGGILRLVGRVGE